MPTHFILNGKPKTVDVDPNMPLLWVVRDTLNMTGTKFGCGMALCGACTVHIDGEATRSCITPISSVAGKKVTTIEGLSATDSHPVQRAWIEIDVPQCGYCQSGQIMTASALLAKTPHPPTTKLTTPWRATSAAAAHTTGFARRFTAPRSCKRAAPRLASADEASELVASAAAVSTGGAE